MPEPFWASSIETVLAELATRPDGLTQIEVDRSAGEAEVGRLRIPKGRCVMTSEGTSADRSREIRLGLVMYGGVSLAIYIYGVAQEFFNAVRGRGVFKLIKALTDSDIVVDVVSGTSAGGINGILLSYCLANDFEISAAASTWRDQGGIAAMLRDPVRDPDPPSVLQGDAYFLKELEKTFERLKSFPLTPENAPGDDPSKVRELDLFVTGTDVDGRVTTRFDAVGNSIDVKDHRVVFHLKHRADRKEQFKAGRIGDDSDVVCKALGKLARVTSSFPAAFEPVQIAGKAVSESLDGQLGYWAWGNGGTERNVFLADGGILDNKPFTPTIREIFHRTSEREVERWLFYVEPDPERFQKQSQVVEPNVFKIVLGSLSSIPSYESIADDLNKLNEHNEKVKRFRRLVDYSRSGDGLGLDPDSLDFVKRWQSWEAGTPAPVEALPTDSVPSTERPSPYSQSRLIEISERVVQGLLRIGGRDAQLSEQQCKAAEALLKAYDQWPGNGDFTLYNLDVDFRIRRLFHLLYTCPKPKLGGGADAERLAQTRYALNRQLKLLEIIRAAVERLLDLGEFGWTPAGDPPARGTQVPEGWDVNLWRYQVADAFVFLLHSADILPKGYQESWETGWPGKDWLSKQLLEDVRRKLEDRVADAMKYLANGEIHDRRPKREAFANILMVTDACERWMLRQTGDQTTRPLTAPNGASSPKVARVLRQEYEDFIRVDAVLFPLQAFSGLHERDIIKTVRISPLEARRGFSGRPLAEKVSGDALAHFGGFLKKSWRSNDILWGRLDAVCQLTETLLVRTRVADVVSNQGMREALNELNVEALFPRSPAPTRKDLASWVSSLASADEGVRQQALQEGRFGEMMELLIEAQQLEILSTELPTVINDAVAQQMEWNQFRIPRHEAESLRYDPGTQTFYRYGGGELDPLVVSAASLELAKKTANDLNQAADDREVARPKDTALGRFFINKYKVGAEELDKDIPTVVLLQILSTTLLVTRNCLLAALDKTRSDAIRRNWLYRLFTAALWSFDGAVALMRRGELQVITIVAVLALFSGMALYVGASWWNAIIHTNDGFQLIPFILFILVPCLVFGTELWLLSNAAWQDRAGSEPNAFEERHPLGRVAPSRVPALLVVLAVLTVVTAALSYGEPNWQTQLLDRATGPDNTGPYWKSIAWDSAFLVVYTGLLSLAGLGLARRLRRYGSVIAPFGILLAWLALAAGAVDAIENLAVAVLLAVQKLPSDSVAHSLLTVGSYCSHHKFVLPIVIVIGLALMTLPLIARWARRR